MAVLAELQRMSDERFLAIYESLQENGFGPLDAQVATSLKFRPQAIRKLPLEKRARRARMLLERGANAELAYELFGSYLLRHHRPLVTGFLDATGVPHEEGLIEDSDASPPRGEEVPEAVRRLEAEHAPEDVALYLALAVAMWPEVPEVRQAWEQRAGSAQA